MIIEPAPTNHGVLGFDERLVDVVAPLVAYPQTPRPLLPTERALRHPPVATQLLATQLLAALNASAGQPWHNAAFAQALTQLFIIIGFVRVNFSRAAARPAPFAPHRSNRIHGLQKTLAVRHIGPRKNSRQRQAVSVYDLVALRAGLAPIHRRRASRLARRPPFFAASLLSLPRAPLARIKMLSTLARLQSIRCAASSFASRVSCSVCHTRAEFHAAFAIRVQSFMQRLPYACRVSCSVCHTPACCQSLSRRQQVMPLPQPISWGKSSQPMPLLRTNKMPVKAARSGTGGRPRFPGWARCGGKRGSTIAQSSSETSAFAIPVLYPTRHFC